MGEALRVSGREFDSRPPHRGGSSSSSKRLSEIVEALDFAAGNCSELERRLYKSIREVQAHAMNLRDQNTRERLPDPLLSDLRSAEHEL